MGVGSIRSALRQMATTCSVGSVLQACATVLNWPGVYLSCHRTQAGALGSESYCHARTVGRGTNPPARDGYQVDRFVATFLIFGRHQPLFNGVGGQCRCIVQIELSHDVGAVFFDSLDTDVEKIGNLFINIAFGQ
jgi:hypothetical protein